MKKHSQLYRNTPQQYSHNSLHAKYKTDMSEEIYSSQQQIFPLSNKLQYGKPVTPQQTLQNFRGYSNHIDSNCEYYEKKSDIGKRSTHQNAKHDRFFSQAADQRNSLEVRYKKINAILQNENRNLKQQNQQLVIRCDDLYNKKEKYKNLYQNNKVALQLAIQQRQTYRLKAQQLAAIIQKDMKDFYQRLTEKAQEVQDNGHLSQQQLSIFTQKPQRNSSTSQNFQINKSYLCSPDQQSYETSLRHSYQNQSQIQSRNIHSPSKSHLSQLGKRQFSTTTSKKYQIEPKIKYKF